MDPLEQKLRSALHKNSVIKLDSEAFIKDVVKIVEEERKKIATFGNCIEEKWDGHPGMKSHSDPSDGNWQGGNTQFNTNEDPT